MKKRALLPITTELFRQILCIPDGVELSGVMHDVMVDRWLVQLAGDGLPDACQCEEGDVIKVFKPTYSTEEGSIVSGVSWKVET